MRRAPRNADCTTISMPPRRKLRQSVAKQLLKSRGESVAELELDPCPPGWPRALCAPWIPVCLSCPALCSRKTLSIYTSSPQPKPAGWEALAGHWVVEERDVRGSCVPSFVLFWDWLCPSELFILPYLQL